MKARLANLRLVDGVVVAAAGLLGLKALGLLAGGSPTGEGERRPAFGHVIAHARTNFEPTDPTTTGSVPEKAKPATPAPPSDPPVAGGTSGTAERAILERLGERRDELQQRARDADLRARVIEESERRLDQKLGELRSLDEKREAEGGGSGKPDAAVRSLVTMYETMKPKEAARVFDRLPHDVLLPVVRGMNPRKMAEVLAAMTPENAERLTVALARPAGKPTDLRPGGSPALPPGELPAIEPTPGSR